MSSLSSLHEYCNCWQNRQFMELIHTCFGGYVCSIRSSHLRAGLRRAATAGLASPRWYRSFLNRPTLQSSPSCDVPFFKQSGRSAKTNNPIAAKLSHHVKRKPLNPDATCLAPALFCSPLVSRGSSHYGRGLPSCAHRHSLTYS